MQIQDPRIDVVELHGDKNGASIDVMMARSLAEIQRTELEAEGWTVEIRDRRVA
jgi:hypothetical protein